MASISSPSSHDRRISNSICSLRRSLFMTFVLSFVGTVIVHHDSAAAARDYLLSSALVGDLPNGVASNLRQPDPPKQAVWNNPVFSIDPLPYSLHPDWKLWTEMSPFEQDQAMDRVGVYLKKYGDMIQSKLGPTKKQMIKQGNCDVIPIANQGDHSLCGPKPDSPCNFISFGINDDPSFDRALAEEWGCRGFAGDPTVEHPSKLHPLVTFHNVGATMLMNNEEREINKGGKAEWWLVSMPKLRAFLGLQHVDVVKLDCEGCEVALARDILREDPTYLHHVDQISIETHVTRTWLDTREHVYYFGLHFALLEEAGFVLEWSNVFGCSKRHEVTGCMPELEQYGFPCGYRDWPGKTKVVLGWSCQDFLWKRYPERATGPFAKRQHAER